MVGLEVGEPMSATLGAVDGARLDFDCFDLGVGERDGGLEGDVLGALKAGLPVGL